MSVQSESWQRLSGSDDQSRVFARSLGETERGFYFDVSASFTLLPHRLLVLEARY
jgi:hypothetical protein